MYNLISALIAHTWQTGTNASGEQQYIYYICGSVIVILVVVFIDLVYRLFRSILKIK